MYAHDKLIDNSDVSRYTCHQAAISRTFSEL